MINNKQYRFTLFTNRDCTIENTPEGHGRVFKFLMNMGSRLEQNKEYKMTLESVSSFGIIDQDTLVIRCPNVMGKYFYNNSRESAPIIYAGSVSYNNSSLDLFSYDVDANIMMGDFTLILDNGFAPNPNVDLGIADDTEFVITFLLTEYRNE
tara:strand:+ start:1801 stop:2256 length:456 start_codon:yes stop_codon:yes gene_type:complete